MKKFFILFFIILAGVNAMANQKPVERFYDAQSVLEELIVKPDSGAFKELLKKAKGVAFFPNVIRGGLVVGGQYGEGFLLKRDKENDQWYGPLFLKLYKVSYGPQIGLESIGLILLIMNDNGFEGFTKDNITLGGSLSISAGPVGRSLSADFDYTLQAILSYSLSRGFYAGLTLEGSLIKNDRDANEEFFGRYIESKEILKKKANDYPEISDLIEQLNSLINGTHKENGEKNLDSKI
ncbi:MAG: lipid-binding SYLF domain-containing protein [Kosmotogaceae bacterium]